MKNPRQEQTNSLAKSMGYLMAYDFTHDTERNPEIIKPKSEFENIIDLAFPKRYLKQRLNDLKAHFIPSSEIVGSMAENKLERLKGKIMLEFAKELKRPIRFAKQGECQYTMELEKERRPKTSKPEEVLLSTTRAAKILEVHKTSLNTMRIAGKVEAEKIGGRYFFKPEEVERLRIQRAINKL